jgi:hypothetical protein
MSLDPAWPPIAFDIVRIMLDGEVSRDDIEIARRFMGDLVGRPDLQDRSRALELEAIARLPKDQRAAAAPRAAVLGRPPVAPSRPPPRPAPPAAPAPARHQRAFL